MYRVIEVEDDVGIPPAKFELGLKEAVKASLVEKWEGVVDKDLGVILVVMDVKGTGEGRIYVGDGAVHYPVVFEVLVYTPKQHEIVTGEVIDVTEFGAFMRMGPVDGMIHVSQIMDDFVSYDRKNAIFTGKESKHKLKDGDTIRARIISVSVSGREYKIGLTARQPNLGCPDWIKEERDRHKKSSEKAKAGKKE